MYWGSFQDPNVFFMEWNDSTVTLNCNVCQTTFFFSFFHSLTISSCSKELYAGFSDRHIIAWIKPRQDFIEEEGEYEHIRLENYMHGRMT